MGAVWPCYSTHPRTGEPTPDDPGTPRLFEAGSYNPIAKGAGPFYFADGRARFNVAEYRAAVDDVSAEYPLFLTTGRVVSQFLSGTQTRRIGPLVKQYAEPRIELHPRLADKLGITDGQWATAETRRGAITLRAQVVATIRPDTIFIPYHWPGDKSANRLTVAAQDPISKIPQYKVCGCRLRRAEAAPAYATRLQPQQWTGGRACWIPVPWSSSSTRAAASVARPACRRAPNVTRTAVIRRSISTTSIAR